MSLKKPWSPLEWRTLIYSEWSTVLWSNPLICKEKTTPYDMTSMKHSMYWSIHTKDESKRGTAFAFLFGVNWLWRCGVITSFGVLFHEIKCNGMTSFMDFMSSPVRLLSSGLLTLLANVSLNMYPTLCSECGLLKSAAVAHASVQVSLVPHASVTHTSDSWSHLLQIHMFRSHMLQSHYDSHSICFSPKMNPSFLVLQASAIENWKILQIYR